MSTPAVTPGAPAAPKPTHDDKRADFLPTDEHYRLTGEMPAVKDDPAPSTEPEKKPPVKQEESTPSESETAAAPEAAKTQEKEKTQQRTAAASESRWAKITRENRELREKYAKLEATRARDAEERETKPAPQPAAAQPSTDGKRPEPKITDVDPNTKKPKYATWEDFNRDLRAYDRAEALREFQETSQKSAEERKQSEAFEAIGRSLAEKFAPSREKHPDFDAVALNPDLIMPIGSVTDLFIQDSPHAGEVVYYLGQHPEILEGWYGDFNLKTGTWTNKVTPQQQFRKLMEIEATLSGATGPTPAKPITAAPRPPNQTSGKGVISKDAVEAAVAAGDTEGYMRIQNERALARRKKG
jgi:hypothetical protein